MKKVLFSCIVFLLTTGMANAAGWTGWYIGGHAGYGTAKTDVDFTDFGVSTSTSASSAVAGVHGGFSWHFGNWVLGGEADLDLSNMSKDASCPGGTFTCTTSIDSLSSVRVRIGPLITDDVLVYGTLGPAAGTIETSDNTGAGGGETKGHGAAVVGFGVEGMFSPKWTWRAEFLRYGLSSDTQQFSSPTQDRGDVKANVNVVRAGFSYRF
jgi:outer membrane immunogenic protein